MKRKIIDSVWKHDADCASIVIGIVAAQTDEHLMESMQTWCAYIGLVIGNNKKEDEQKIANCGGKLSAQEAHGFFPNMDIKKYKT